MKRLLLVICFCVAPAYACEPPLGGSDVQRVESDRYVLAYRTTPARIAVGEHFVLDIASCGKGGRKIESLRVDAYMPAHRHNMNYTPTVRPTANNRWRAEGLLLHMPGQWDLQFDLYTAGEKQRLTRSLQLD